MVRTVSDDPLAQRVGRGRSPLERIHREAVATAHEIVLAPLAAARQVESASAGGRERCAQRAQLAAITASLYTSVS